jgi:hypothetical protein
MQRWIANTTVDSIVNGTKVVEFDTPAPGFSNNLIVFVLHVNNNKEDTLQELKSSIETDSFNPGYKILEANTAATLSKQPAYLLLDSTRNANGVRSILSCKEHFYDIQIYYYLFTIGILNANVAPLPSGLFSAHILPP